MHGAEFQRLEADAARKADWKRFGPYLSERQWATVREDYSADGDAWTSFPFDHARSRAYRWGEDGLLGVTDRQCRICFALAMWNGRDPILKERLFGLTNLEGNHGAVRVRLRLAEQGEWPLAPFDHSFAGTFAQRKAEADEYYAQLLPPELSTEERHIARQAAAGMLWSKQFYHYIVEDWLNGDPNSPPPPESRRAGRNADWPHLFSRDVLAMPDKWEYPWFAAWDLAFQMLPLGRLDLPFAKEQLELLLREWYMHPNGQLPAYEYDFTSAAPPVHAWACRKLYDQSGNGKGDIHFLAGVFLKLLLNFTWWVNRKDARGRHLFSGGFLGLDNIGVFDRSQPMPGGETLEQADGTAWMAFYCGTMLSMALELAKIEPGAEDIASKFFEHYIHIADAMNHFGGSGLWDEEDGYDSEKQA